MNDKHIIVSENKRPYWQVILGSLILTVAVAVIILLAINGVWSDKTIKLKGASIELAILLIGLGVSLVYQKTVHIDLKKSKFRSTFEIGPVKLGEWKTINKLEYISIFRQPLDNGEYIIEVNLWYDTNKHWELYEEYNFEEAFLIGWEISDELNIDLLDATIANDYKWIDKEAFKSTGKIVYKD